MHMTLGEYVEHWKRKNHPSIHYWTDSDIAMEWIEGWWMVHERRCYLLERIQGDRFTLGGES